jgi:hypothetical protein
MLPYPVTTIAEALTSLHDATLRLIDAREELAFAISVERAAKAAVLSQTHQSVSAANNTAFVSTVKEAELVGSLDALVRNLQSEVSYLETVLPYLAE